MINNLNIRLKTIKLLGENLGVSLHDHGNGFLNDTKTKQPKGKKPWISSKLKKKNFQV